MLLKLLLTSITEETDKKTVDNHAMQQNIADLNIAVIWNDNSYASFLKNHFPNWTIITSKKEYKKIKDFSVFNLVLILSELDWKNRHYSCFYGTNILRHLRNQTATRTLPIITTSLFSKHYLKTEFMNISPFLFMMAHHSTLNVGLTNFLATGMEEFDEMREASNRIKCFYKSVMTFQKHEDSVKDMITSKIKPYLENLSSEWNWERYNVLNNWKRYIKTKLDILIKDYKILNRKNLGLEEVSASNLLCFTNAYLQIEASLLLLQKNIQVLNTSEEVNIQIGENIELNLEKIISHLTLMNNKYANI